MWKYRDSGILSGWNGAVLVIAFFAGLIAGFVLIVTGEDAEGTINSDYLQFLPMILPLLIILLGWLVFRRHTHDDDEYRKAPVTPEWRHVETDSKIISGMRGSCKVWCIVWLIITLVASIIAAVAMFKNPPADRLEWFVCGAGLLFMVLFNIRNAMRWCFWCNPPESMEYTVIETVYYSEQIYHVRGGRRKRVKMYFFLPKGRYRVILNLTDVSKQPPDLIYFVRWHGIVRWVHWDD